MTTKSTQDMDEDRHDRFTEFQSVAAASKVGGAVGLSVIREQPRHWYVAVVSNNSEKQCGLRLARLFEQWAARGQDCEVYVPIQKERRVWRDGRRRMVERVVLPALVFIRCTEAERRRDIAYLPFVKRFFVNVAGAPVNVHRPVAVIPDRQMADLRRMVEEADAPVSFEARPLHVGERVRVNGGKLVGLTGNVLREADGTTSLLVGIDILGYAKVSIQRDLLDAIGG